MRQPEIGAYWSGKQGMFMIHEGHSDHEVTDEDFFRQPELLACKNDMKNKGYIDAIFFEDIPSRAILKIFNASASKKVYIRVNQIHGDLTLHITIGLMGIKAGRRGICYRRGSDYAGIISLF